MIFENVTERAGIVWSGSRGSFSTGWTDFNRDGLPDLWISPHAYWNYGSVDLNHPKLYLNQGNNSFIDIGKQIFFFCQERILMAVHGLILIMMEILI